MSGDLSNYEHNNGFTSSIDDVSSSSYHVKQMDRPSQTTYLTSISQQPVTQHRPLYIPTMNDLLTDAGTARATLAASKESPNGTVEDDYAKRHQDQTVRLPLPGLPSRIIVCIHGGGKYVRLMTRERHFGKYR